MSNGDDDPKVIKEVIGSPALQKALADMEKLELECSAKEIKDFSAKVTIHVRDKPANER